MAEWPANGVKDWNTKSLAYLAIEHATDGTHNAAGMVRQVVNVQDGAVSTGTTQMPLDDTIPQITEGDEYMTLAVTPKSATNKLKIDVVTFASNTYDGSPYLTTALFQDTTASALAAMSSQPSALNRAVTTKFTHYMTAGTASETTFRIRIGVSGAGTTTFNGTESARKLGGVMASSITITEIQV